MVLQYRDGGHAPVDGSSRAQLIRGRVRCCTPVWLARTEARASASVSLFPENVHNTDLGGEGRFRQVRLMRSTLR